ncbi:MAG: hypothetical protein AzoDbin1_00414 [Azoarcus sp.]|nr:hypothetical protein [Azoarcus sp.]
MKILVCGAAGFIGKAICARLAAAGHEVVRGVRKPVRAGDVAIDFAADTAVARWSGRLAGVEVVVNAVGIIRESADARFDDMHHRAPAALFAACALAGVRRVVQISALGAETRATPYFASKYAADRCLTGLPMEWLILRPALVYGADGISASMFRMFASLPVVPLPALGAAEFQPIHIDDLAAAVERAVASDTPSGQQIDLAGGTRVSYREMLECLRRGMGFPRPLYLLVPAPLMALAARIAGWIPRVPLTPDSWRMLRAGSAADAAAAATLLGHAPKGIEDFIAPADAELLRQRALAAWRGPLLRLALALVWIVTAFVSAFVHPVEHSLELLARVGLGGWPATLALYGAAAVDLALGIACLAYPRRALWAAQAALVIGYTAIIAVALPGFLAHPFGPVLKNVPILAILFILAAEEPSWTT